MSTRSITHIHEMDSLDGESIVCSFFRHSDGYPDGHGDQLAKWLNDQRLVNGIGRDFKKGRDHNRAGQMAIELMYHLKQDTSIEVIPTGSFDRGEEYIYHITFDDNVKEFDISCKCTYSKRTAKFRACIFSGETVDQILNSEDEG